MKNFWKKLKKPIICLAPMADVTDCAFRQIIAKYSGDTGPTEQSFGRVFWTEFVSADGLAHSVAREKLLIDLKYGENERPIVAQIFGSKPENIKKASALCKELGFDGIDINMGCPEKNIQKQCACAALIKDPKLAREIIRSAIEGAGGLPVSVKTRIGYNKNEIGSSSSGWIQELLSENLAALTVHLRTKKEMSNVPAHWEEMKRIVEIRDELQSKTLIIGNGDVVDLEDARQKIKETGCDGVMLGRAIFGNPWLFSVSPREVSVSQRLAVLIEHTKLFEKMLGQCKNFAIMKKHFKAYVNGSDARPTEQSFGRGAKELRVKLMATENASQVEEIVNDFLTTI